MNERGLPIDTYNHVNVTILEVDISLSEIEKQYNKFLMYVDANLRDGHVTTDGINGVVFPLTSLFLLAGGKQVYERRKYVLDKLEESGDEGDVHFAVLMDCLASISRDEDNKRHLLPNTVANAKKYFKVK